MGAEYQSMRVKGENRKDAREQFESAQKQDLYENGHSYSGGFGMADGLEFCSEHFESFAEADNFLANTAEKWGPALAVTYQDEKGTLNFLIGAWCSS